MEALKWFGSFVAAIAALSVAIGVGGFIVAVLVIGGAIFAAIALVVFVAACFKDALGSSKRR